MECGYTVEARIGIEQNSLYLQKFISKQWNIFFHYSHQNAKFCAEEHKHKIMNISPPPLKIYIIKTTFEEHIPALNCRLCGRLMEKKPQQELNIIMIIVISGYPHFC